MKPIINPVDRSLLVKELSSDKLLRKTNNGNNELYILTYHDSPNVMKEIGRIRELAFRTAGGGTGKEIDIDKYDTAESPYKQLVVWDPNGLEIVGGYRYIKCKDAPLDEEGKVILATRGLFEFSDEFRKDYLPYVMELGRSFVHPEYQSRTSGRRSIFILDNLWDGLGALVHDNTDMKYLFGKVTMYAHYNVKARDILLHFFKLYFHDEKNLVYTPEPIEQKTPQAELDTIFGGQNYADDYKILSQKVRELGETIPPLINSYMNISPTLKSFGTAVNRHFGDVEETGIIVTIADIYDAKKDRHISSYKTYLERLS